MGPSRSSTAHLDGLGTFSPDRIKSWLPGFHRAMSLHPSRCNGYVNAHRNQPARHSHVRRVGILALVLPMLLAPAHASAAAAPKPNLLVIITDDQEAQNTLQVMPQTRRRIGRQGTTYLEAHASTPKCCPSRASFFT